MKQGPERVFDYLLALSLVSWGVMGWTQASGNVSLVRLSISALHLAVAVQIARRAPLVRQGSARHLVQSLPALILGGLALKAAAPLASWPGPAVVTFLLGTALTIGSFHHLGRNFAIFPARRGLTDNGPYAWLRHPAYAGELLMVLGCALSLPSVLSLSVLTCSFPLLALRIRAEEEVLAGDERYQLYRQRVRFRLLPGVW